jgi:hypothetical protein
MLRKCVNYLLPKYGQGTEINSTFQLVALDWVCTRPVPSLLAWVFNLKCCTGQM